MEKLTIQEEEVMIYIWELQSCFVKDIVAKYTQPAPPYTTVASIVKNLERKGYVTPKRGVTPTNTLPQFAKMSINAIL